MGCKGCEKRQAWLDKNAPKVGKATRATHEALVKARDSVAKRVRNIK